MAMRKLQTKLDIIEVAMEEEKLANLVERIASHADTMINLSLIVGRKCLKKEILEESEDILTCCEKIFQLINSSKSL